jgi:hypothetical protein
MFRKKRAYAIELDGNLYRVSGNRLERIVDLKDLEGDYWFVSDMQEVISRTMTVEVEPKYAELIVDRKLRESGDFDESVTVIAHRKKRKSGKTTDIFFSALPSRLYHSYFDQIHLHEHSILLFPLSSILYGVLKCARSAKPICVIFQHNRFADLIIGCGKKVFYTNRFVAFDDGKDQIASLWETIRNNIKEVETDNRIQLDQIILLNWIDSGAPPDWPENTEYRVQALENEEIHFNGDIHHISFLTAVDRQSAAGAVSSLMDKARYYAGRFTSYGMAVFLAVSLLLLVGNFWYRQQSDFLQKKLHTLESKIAGIQLNSPKTVSLEELDSSIAFLKDLSFYRRAPAYKTIMNDIADGFAVDMVLETLKMDYTPNEILVEAFGRIRAPFKNAYKGYQRCLRTLNGKGYFVTVNHFDTQIKDSQFLIKFGKKLQ